MRYIGLDLGTKTLGVAISDITGTIATSYKVIRHNNDFDYLIKELKNIIEEKQIETIVLGLPKNMNNTIGERGQMVLEFKEKLKTYNLPIILEDERLTTRLAENILITADVSRKKRKKVIDKMAANVILQSYLDRSKNERSK